MGEINMSNDVCIVVDDDDDDDDDDEIEIKPRIENLIPGRPAAGIPEHSVHDFSIHLHKLKEYRVPNTSFVLEGAECQQKSEDCFFVPTCCGLKKWTSREVLDVITIEGHYFGIFTVFIKLPDNKINKQIVEKQTDGIRAVHFLNAPQARRCCFVLTDPKKKLVVLKKLICTRLGQGYFARDSNYNALIPSISDIDPFTLFVDIAPYNLSHDDLRKTFSTSQQIMICYKIKMNYKKRFAFVVFSTIKSALLTFIDVNKFASLLVRFRRFSGPATIPSEYDIRKSQGNGKNFRLGTPIIIDPGLSGQPRAPSLPVISEGRNNRIMCRAVRAESVTNNQVVLNNDDVGNVDNNISPSSLGNYYTTTDFMDQYIGLRRSHEIHHQQDQAQD